MNTVEYKKSYYANKVGSTFQEQSNGVCLVVEYEINSVLVRFIVVKVEMSFADRRSLTTMIQEQKDVVGNWKTIGDPITMVVNDDYYVNVNDGDTYSYAESIELVDDLDKPIPNTDPQEYSQIQKIKDGYIKEVDYLHSANTGFNDLVEANVKAKILKIYE